MSKKLTINAITIIRTICFKLLSTPWMNIVALAHRHIETLSQANAAQHRQLHFSADHTLSN